MTLGRRSILKFMGAAPVAAPALGSQATMRLAGVEVGAGVALAQGYGASVGPAKPLRFLSFASWLSDIGEERLRREASQVRFLDPDIACMALPLTTKIRWQTERNYRALLRERQGWFERTIRHNGEVTEWT